MKPTLLPRIHAAGLAAISLTTLLPADTLFRSGGGDWEDTLPAWGTASGGPYTADIWDNAAPDSAVLEGIGGVLDLTAPITANSITFDAIGFSLENGSLSFGGTTPTVTTHADGTINSPIDGGTLLKNGAGRLTLGGGMNLTDRLTLAEGTTAFTGASDYIAGTNSPLWVGSGAGSRAVLELQSTGLVSLGASLASSRMEVGRGSGVSGAVYQDSGDLRIGSTNSYGYVAVGVAGGYGYYRLDGGTIDVGPGNGRLGLIVGDSGGALGVWEQTGGEATFSRYVVFGNGSGAVRGEGTLTGGTFNQTLAGNYILVGDDGDGQLNLGTLAGGDALISTAARTKIGEADNTANGHLNLNSGTLRFTHSAGGINADPDGRDTPGRELALALNGATIQSAADNIKLIWGDNDAPLSTRLYNGGITIDTQGYDALIETSIDSPTGNGVYIDTTFSATATGAGGAGFIGVPQVEVSGGSGSGAQVKAEVDQATGTITGFVVVNPGQGYQAGDTLTFTLNGGGASTAADPYSYTLGAGDLQANGGGSLTKIGTGNLTFTAANGYTGDTIISAGTVTLAGLGSIDQSARIVVGDTVSSGAALDVTTKTGGFTVGSAQLLAGYGTVLGDTTLDSGAVLAPGMSIGTLSFADDLALNSGSVWEVEIGGTGVADFDQLLVSGQLTAGGTIAVSLVNLFAPTAGDSFSIASFDSLVDAGYDFDFSAASLDAGLSWDTQLFGSTGTIGVIPEPGSAWLLLLPACMALCRRVR